MPVFDRYNCIHIHIPKTGGTSINTALGIEELTASCGMIRLQPPSYEIVYGNIKENGITDYELDHATANYVKKIVGDKWNSHFTFAFVRNPYSRLLSQYFHVLKNNDSRFIGNWNIKMTFSDFVHKVKNSYDRIATFNHFQKDHYMNQTSFIFDSETNEQLVNYIGKFESLAEDVSYCSSKTTEPFQISSEKKMTTIHAPYNMYYNEELKNIVFNMYEEDFVNFGYSRDIELPEPSECLAKKDNITYTKKFKDLKKTQRLNSRAPKRGR